MAGLGLWSLGPRKSAEKEGRGGNVGTVLAAASSPIAMVAQSPLSFLIALLLVQLMSTDQDIS